MIETREILFLALTRPALTWGVPFEALALNILFCFCAGMELSGPTIWRSPMMFWLAAIPIHWGLQKLTSWDYHWFRTVRLWAMALAASELDPLATQRARTASEVASSV